MNETHLINVATCTRCELCVTICPAAIITKEADGVIAFRSDRQDICICCGHCMAMCETNSIKIDGLSQETNFRTLPAEVIGCGQLMDFLLTRRSVRVFKDKPVPEDVVLKILDAIATAPFGVSPGNIEIAVVTDKALIEQAVPYFSKMYVQLGMILKIPLLGWMIRRSMKKEDRNTVMNFIVPHLAKGLYTDTGKVDDIARNAPAMFIFHAPKGAEEHTVDGHICLTYAMLAAHSLGLGATAIGLIGPVINQSKPLRAMFRIPEENEVVETMILGYPKLHFKKAITRPRKKLIF